MASHMPPNSRRQMRFSKGENGSLISRRIAESLKYIQAETTQKKTNDCEIMNHSEYRLMMNVIDAKALILVEYEGCMNSSTFIDQLPLTRRSNIRVKPGPLPRTIPMSAIIT